MANSTLEHDQSTPGVTLKGHGTAALGPSDSSDSGSDIQGGAGLEAGDGLVQGPDTVADADIEESGATAGADIGDADLDSDSDRNGTGERGAAGRDSVVPVDTLLRDEHGELVDGGSIVADTDEDGTR